MPHMGWNSVDFVDPEEQHTKGVSTSTPYYFVHSFRAAYDHTKVEAAQWVQTTAQYGQEVFVASVRKGNVFGTQFHPEKSGEAGLHILDAWLKKSVAELTNEPPRPVHPIPLKPRGHESLTKRIIACMDVRSNDEGDLVVTKGDQYDVREKSSFPPHNLILM